MKLRTVLILATMVLVGMLLSGLALAVNKNCSTNCVGTNRPDRLIGSGNTNTLSGLGDADTLKGLGRADLLKGDGGNDDVFGGAGGDSIYGGPGRDVLHGKEKGDFINGIDGRVPYSTAHHKLRIEAAKARTVEVLIGDSGNDTMKANDGKRDIIRGGPGHDTAYVDPVDTVMGVEEDVVPGSGPGPNEIPVANNDSYSANQNGYLNVSDPAEGVLSNDTDADNPNNTNFGLTVKDANPNTPGIDPVSGPSNGVLLALNADGSFEYDTDLNNPAPDCFTYKATDGAADSNVATVKINGGNPPC